MGVTGLKDFFYVIGVADLAETVLVVLANEFAL